MKRKSRVRARRQVESTLAPVWAVIEAREEACQILGGPRTRQRLRRLVMRLGQCERYAVEAAATLQH